MKNTILIYSLMLSAFFYFNSKNANAQWYTNGSTNVYTFDKAGIGTSNPNALLHIKGNIPQIRFEESDNSNKKWHIETYNKDLVFVETDVNIRMSIKSGGNIGIGTSTPQGLLHIKGTIPQIRFEESDNSNKKWHIETYNKDLVFVETGIATRFCIDQGGNIGIGTNSRAQKLDVIGNIKATNFYFSSGGSSLLDRLSSLQSQINWNYTKISSLESCCNTKSALGTEELFLQPKLFQNIPNPFDFETELKYYVPEKSNTASILIHNISGVLVKSIEVENKGESSVFISGSELKPGIYAYSLSIDGIVIDTKTMVLTK